MSVDCSQYFLIVLFKVSLGSAVTSSVSFLILVIQIFSLLLLVSFARGLSILLILSKKQLCLFCLQFFHFNFIDLRLYFYYFFPSACFGFILLLLFQVLEIGAEVIDVRSPFFLTHTLSSLPQHCFICVPLILTGCIFIFTQLSKSFDFLETSSLTRGLFRSLLFCSKCWAFSYYLSLILLQFDSIVVGIISTLLNLLRFAL